MRENTDRGGNGSELADRPVTQNADDFVVCQRPAQGLIAQQAGGYVVRRSIVGCTTHGQKILDVAVKLKGHSAQGGFVSGQGGCVILQCP
ncbi:hypothetical protein D3C80_1600310 [compost metagenome]